MSAGPAMPGASGAAAESRARGRGSAGSGGRGGRGIIRAAGAVIALLLLGAALLMVWRQREAVSQALDAVRGESFTHVAVHAGILLGSVLLTVLLSGLTFSALMSRHGRVGLLEMQALIASSMLMNYLPLRPGLFGRAAYHRIVNQIPVISTAKVVLTAAGLSGAVAGCAALALWAGPRTGASLWVMLAGLPVGLALIAMFWPARRMIALAGLARSAELFAGAARYYASFALIGVPIALPQALAFACIGMIAGMAPLLGNGLGLREWAVGAAAPLLTTAQVALGITADLLNRAAEIAIAVPAGLLGMAVLLRLRGAPEPRPGGRG